jgi:hypothetical protein
MLVMKTNWKVTPRGDHARGCDAAIYVTLTPKGVFAFNRSTWHRLGAPKALHVLFDPPNNRIGLKPAQEKIANAYPVFVKGKAGLRGVRCQRVMAENGLKLPDTVRFGDADIDHDGILICDLRTAKVPANVTGHWTRKKREAAANGHNGSIVTSDHSRERKPIDAGR